MRSLRLWLTPGIGVKRFVALALTGGLGLTLGVVGVTLWLFGEERSVLSAPIEEYLTSSTWYAYGGWLSAALVAAGVSLSAAAIAGLNRSLLSHWLRKPKDAALLLNRKVHLAKGPKIVALGGGSGLANLLRGLRAHTSNLTAVVAVSDDGGSSGRLREAYGMPAPGDLTDCLAALSDNELELTQLLQYRFARGEELKGHTFGNLLITTVMEMEGDFARAVHVINRLLNISGRVYPATPQPVKLVSKKASGETVFGEHLVREVPGAVEELRIEPANPPGLPEVASAIVAADLVVMGPGSLFSSSLPPALVPSVREAINTSRAKLVYVVNIMTEPGETDGFDAFDHVHALARHGVRYPDVVLVNSGAVDRSRLLKYRSSGAQVVAPARARFEEAGINLVELPMVGRGEFAQHDPERLAGILKEFANGAHANKLAAMSEAPAA